MREENAVSAPLGEQLVEVSIQMPLCAQLPGRGSPAYPQAEAGAATIGTFTAWKREP
ncbi:hypothetical protein GCM10022286_20180 [Gryllotalpicola daejeonensis]|uniref:Uncharacterized protein n=1 Tax=Gryllotalpicola daejeonensis TaxID=993087 RepID=A0ABP7ZKP4_9MICO